MLLQVNDVYKSYSKIGLSRGKDKLNVLQGISFCVKEGDCVGLIGESGSGKSTLSRLILGLEKANSGSITIEGQPVKKWIKENQGQMSVVFQDYTSSANPRFTIKEVIAEPLIALGRKGKIEEKVEELLNRVGLSKSLMYRYPHELSGGQLQRVCIARAISTNPMFMVLDEAISSLDVSIQAQILQLLKELKKDLNMTYLFIAHDLQAVASVCDEVLFLYRGKLWKIYLVIILQM
ncbi:nickel transport system ATP-binding protein [Clostridium tetanomorphum]|uniref:ABC transporter ATP-binding protein n=1 Tax=Clostridium tetanomorphum TaxID=1553 RepID=UPI000451C710|nr:dipeptide/oligopeptide/nickel ABC transporter ATP-binding protein [Clostridium tetanomorphum]KAJ50785.1 ABC transporter-like protein [Clostridium tetanomorphum DSM 665]MBP1866414.1 nickel transport system ATP-binding protein [Clostridium tetanomorphum]NRS83194.1 nickel transport system ATP-binding protein [Clostridium tetanomorphum]NRZ98706.1 nickel transport system ATP-binding protein [Clostridium tetanomorphum]SQC01242.1 oligopeptide transport ATP-binding protein AppF [Clostridium tetanom